MKFRNYENSKDLTKVEKTYKEMLENQTKTFVCNMKKKFLTNFLDKPKFNIWELTQKLDEIIDESDPDTDLPQIVHAYQTANSLENKIKENILIKKLFTKNEWSGLPQKYKELYGNKRIKDFYKNILDWDWLILIGFIHDLGKIMLLPNYGELPQWAVVGDTFPIDIELSSNYNYYEKGYHLNNESINKSNYQEIIGFENIDFSWGHDEYLASILENSINTLPREAFYIVRYHSFYSWHTPRNEKRGYEKYASEQDWYMLPLLKLFQKSDLYSKTKDIPDTEKIKNKFDKIIEKYNCSKLKISIV